MCVANIFLFAVFNIVNFLYIKIFIRLSKETKTDTGHSLEVTRGLGGEGLVEEGKRGQNVLQWKENWLGGEYTMQYMDDVL